MSVIRLDTGLRIQPLADELGPREEDFLFLMAEYPPDTKLKHGDIVFLTHVPPRIREDDWFNEFGVPRYWKVQFVVSMYQYELHVAMQTFMFDSDQAVTYLERTGCLHPREYRKPMVYAHGFPHGDNPNTAQWFPERILRRLVLRTADVDWEPTLDEFKTPFEGYASHECRGGFVLDLAPDLYGEDCELIGGPLSHEESTFDTAAKMGLEESMMVKRTARDYEKVYRYSDPDHDHDVFVDPFDGEIVRGGWD